MRLVWNRIRSPAAAASGSPPQRPRPPISSGAGSGEGGVLLLAGHQAGPVICPHALLRGDRLVAGLQDGLDRGGSLGEHPALFRCEADQFRAAGRTPAYLAGAIASGSLDTHLDQDGQIQARRGEQEVAGDDRDKKVGVEGGNGLLGREVLRSARHEGPLGAVRVRAALGRARWPGARRRRSRRSLPWWLLRPGVRGRGEGRCRPRGC